MRVRLLARTKKNQFILRFSQHAFNLHRHGGTPTCTIISSVLEGLPTRMLSYWRNQLTSDSLLTVLLLAAFTIFFIVTFLGSCKPADLIP